MSRQRCRNSCWKRVNFPELVSLALTSSALPETSEMEKRAVELGRAQFALKAALRSGRYLDAAKLALKAGEQTAGDGRRRKLIQSNTDLAALFFEPELIQEIVSRRVFDSGWRGSPITSTKPDSCPAVRRSLARPAVDFGWRTSG